MSIPKFAPHMRDAAREVTLAFPAASAAANSGSVDLGHDPGAAPSCCLGLRVAWPDLAAHTDNTKTITVTLQDSADNSSFATVNPSVVLNLTGVATTGLLADEFVMPLPLGVRRYVRVAVANPASGPAITSLSLTIGAVG